MKRVFKGISTYEKRQTKRALARKPINLSALAREGHREQEHDLVAGALFAEDARRLVSSFAYMLPDTEVARETVAGVIEGGLRAAAAAALNRVKQ